MLLTLTIMTQPPEQNSEAVAGGAFENFENFSVEVSFLQSCNPSGLQRC